MNYQEKVIYIQKIIEVNSIIIEKYPYYLFGNDFGLSENLKLLKEMQMDLSNAHKVRISSADLKDYEEYLTTVYQEASGEAIELFWRIIKDRSIPLKRLNKMAKILKRGRIKDQYEYDFVTDVIVPYIQANMITAEEEIALKQMLGKFEMKQK
jgi:hypothetical protein